MIDTGLLAPVGGSSGGTPSIKWRDTADFWSHSFHATPIGLMLKCPNQRGHGAPVPSPFRRLWWEGGVWDSEGD